MIRLFLVLILSIVFIDAKEDIDKKIKKTSTTLDSMSKTYSSINKKMSQNAKSILKQKQEIEIQQEHLKNLQIELEEKKDSYEVNIAQLKDFKSSHKVLKESQEKLEEELVLTIAKTVSISVVLEESNAEGADSLMELEVLKHMLGLSKEKAAKLNQQVFNNSNVINNLNAQVHSLEAAILEIDTKRQELLAIQKSNKKALEKLFKDKNSYKAELQDILNKQDILKKTLAKLSIIKIDEIKKAKEQKERQRAFAEQQQIEPESNLPKVKKHGSSYQTAKTTKYKGPKTIAPLDSYTITKKYGTYTDPIYGIKIFNESISLKPNEPNAKVKTVFNGKVIYADKTAVLDNIVIIENSDGIHTIYANLSQISPNIKTGKKIKKGYTIGRVSNELIFEVTHKSDHINPIHLFQ